MNQGFLLEAQFRAIVHVLAVQGKNISVATALLKLIAIAYIAISDRLLQNELPVHEGGRQSGP